MTNTERWQWLVVVLLLGGLLYLLSPVLTPFALSALLAYLGDPLVDRLERLRLSRSLSVAIVFAFWLVLIVGVLLLLVPFMERQVANLIVQLPRWIDWAQNTAAPWLAEHFDVNLDRLDTQQLTGMLQEHWKEAGGIATTVVAHVSKSGLAIVAWLMHLVLIPVVTFYLLRDWDLLVARVHELVATKYGTWAWNYGENPPSNVTRARRFPVGEIDARVDVQGNRIAAIRFFGDYMGREDVATLEARLRGVPYERDAIAAALGDVELQDYFGAVTREELVDLLVG